MSDKKAKKKNLPAGRKKRKLTPKRKLFAYMWPIYMDDAKTARAAGFSKKSAKQIGNKVRKDPEVDKIIKRLMKKKEDKLELTQERILEELADLGLSNIKNYVEPKEGTKGFVVFKDIDEISEKEARAIEALKVNYKEGRIEFKLHSKTKSLEMLGRYFGMFTDKVEHSGAINVILSDKFLPKDNGRSKSK